MRGGLGIDALGDNDVCKARVARGGLEETLRSNVLVGVVGDEMELLVVRGGDREGLLEQTIGPVDRLCRAGGGGVWRVIELTVCQEAACDSARAPGFAVRPASHASLTLVKAVDGAGPDRLTLNVGQATMDSRDDSQVASCLILAQIGSKIELWLVSNNALNDIKIRRIIPFLVLWARLLAIGRGKKRDGKRE